LALIECSECQKGVIYGVSNRPFNNARNAICFVMQDLPRQQRPTAEVRTEAGRVYKIDEIPNRYRASKLIKS
jgi:hypothetical protein